MSVMSKIAADGSSMQHENYDRAFVVGTTLRKSVKATFRRMAVMVALASVVVGVAGAAVLVYFILSPDWAELAIIAGALTIIALASAVPLATRCADSAARIATDPLELVIGHLSLMGETPKTAPNWSKGGPLSARAMAEDLKLLDRLFRSAHRKARANMEDLTKAQELATAQNEAKSQFLATMSHELRTPLNAILGYAMLLQEDAEETENTSAVADLERIQQAGRNLLSLINDILDLSRIETGKTIVQRTIVDVPSLTDLVIAERATDQQRNGNSFTVDIADDVGVIFSDGAKLRQCLENLLSNAFKFTQNGAVTLAIRNTMTDSFPAMIFTISDTGIGIGKEALAGLFEAFEQAEQHQTRRFGGAGIGLAITRRLARMMGGDCWAESVEGSGSVFYLMIPNGHGRGELDKDSASAAQLQVDRPIVGAKTVLIVEDDDDSLQLMRRWLGQMGLNVLAANDSAVGLECAIANKPDLILLDALMPGMTGYDLLRKLRDDDSMTDTPIVVITVDDDASRGFDAGASDYLRKPILKDELHSLVEVYCGKVSGEILVIDDDEAAADLISRSVREVGFASRHATNGLEGLEMARETRPKAIVLDLTMPGLDGFGVIDRLQSDEGLSDVPLIILSGRRISTDEHRHLVASGHRYFVKGASTPRQIAQSLKELVA